MTNETYNGWTNFETWKVNLEILHGLTANDIWGEKCQPSWVANYVNEIVREGVEGFALSCVDAVLSQVNWNEIAEHLNED